MVMFLASRTASHKAVAGIFCKAGKTPSVHSFEENPLLI